MKTVCLFAFVTLTACCHHDVRLEFPEADAVAGTYECSVTTGPEKCEPSRVVDPASQNSLGTEYVILPKACQKHFHRIVIHDAGSSSPTVHVECAPPEQQKIAPLEPITAPPPAASASPTPALPAAPAGSH
jgi:hypothetical protein